MKLYRNLLITSFGISCSIINNSGILLAQIVIPETSQLINTNSEAIDKTNQPKIKPPCQIEAEKAKKAEIERRQKLAQADRLYRQGKKTEAIALYRQVKQPWKSEITIIDRHTRPDPFSDPALLNPGGKVYWRTYQEGKQQQLESKIIAPLKLLTEKQPEFIRGHLEYAHILQARGQEAEAIQVLDRALNQYPERLELVKAKIAADIQAENWIDASITARQFALFNSQTAEAKEFQQLADEYLENYKSKLRSQLTWNALGNALVGTVGFALTGNLFGPISAIETTVLLLRGESAVGERIAKQAQKKLPLVKDKEVTEYVTKIGNKIASVSGRDDFEYQFYVIMDDRINAFALPGGKIFVNAGAIMNTDSEAELAGLLAHEISHAVLSHGFQLATRGNLTSNVTQYIPYIGNTAGNLIVLNYSRDMERQADVLGTKLLVAADYSADGVHNLMVKLDEESRQKDDPNPPAWLSTHPDSKARISYLENLITNNNLNRYGYEGVTRHQQIKEKMTRLWQKYRDEEAKKAKKDKQDRDEDDRQESDNKPMTNY
jgi:predicted Zn-dependent protease